MRNARKFALLVIAAMSVIASSASAQGITLTNAATGVPCGTVSNTFGNPAMGATHPTEPTNVTGGVCLLHLTSERPVEFRKHIFGIESHIAACNMEFHARVGTTGNGYIYEQHLTSCTRQACGEEMGEKEGWPWGNYDIKVAPPAPAPFTIAESNSTAEVGDTEEMTLRLCIEPETAPHSKEDCTIEIPLDTFAHKFELGHEGEIPGTGIGGFRCELVGHWNAETSGTEDGVAEVEVESIHN